MLHVIHPDLFLVVMSDVVIHERQTQNLSETSDIPIVVTTPPPTPCPGCELFVTHPAQFLQAEPVRLFNLLFFSYLIPSEKKPL